VTPDKPLEPIAFAPATRRQPQVILARGCRIL